ncbi:MAG: DUF3520 domain-containing protein [Rhodopirellula sp.]|nr:DUF3520 domain-containing protein [Rhodopirellula sp.]
MTSHDHKPGYDETAQAKLTAYALGELPRDEALSVEAALDAAQGDAAEPMRRNIRELRALANYLAEAAMQAPLPPPSRSLRETIERRLAVSDDAGLKSPASPVRSRGGLRRRLPAIAALACLLVAAVSLALFEALRPALEDVNHRTVALARPDRAEKLMEESPANLSYQPSSAAGKPLVVSESVRGESSEFSQTPMARGESNKERASGAADIATVERPLRLLDRKPDQAGYHAPARSNVEAPAARRGRLARTLAEPEKKLKDEAGDGLAATTAPATPAELVPGVAPNEGTEQHSYGGVMPQIGGYPTDSVAGDRTAGFSAAGVPASQPPATFGGGLGGGAIRAAGERPAAMPSASAAAGLPLMPGMDAMMMNPEMETRPGLTGRPERAAAGAAYTSIIENPFVDVAAVPRSTFAIGVDTTSYAIVRQSLTSGVLPPPDAVRIEEMVNSFPYDYPPPDGDRPITVHSEVSQCPWNDAHRLVRIGIKARETEPMSPGLATIAGDVTVQVEFNPAEAARYRLIGYEKRATATGDFRDGRKEAGEIDAGHTATALYEIVPAATVASGTLAGGRRELLTVRLRCRAPDGAQSDETVSPLTDSGATFAMASDDFRFAAAVAAFGMLLRHSRYAGEATFAAVRQYAAGAMGEDPGGKRAEFLDLVDRARQLMGP